MAMFEEDGARPRPRAHVVGEDLAALSVDELEARIAVLEGEIARLREAIVKRQATRSAADQLFKS